MAVCDFELANYEELTSPFDHLMAHLSTFLSSHELVFPDRIVICQSEELLTCDHIRSMRILLCIGLSRETLNLLIKKI
jgi:hypothetical protein